VAREAGAAAPEPGARAALGKDFSYLDSEDAIRGFLADFMDEPRPGKQTGPIRESGRFPTYGTNRVERGD
jgi:hypothetical protein